MQIDRDQLAEIFNQLEFRDIRRLCQSNNTFRYLCREKPFSHILGRKYDQHQETIKEKINKGLNDYVKIFNSIQKRGTIIYHLGNNHTIRIFIIKDRGDFDIFYAEEEAFNLPLNEFILNKVLIHEANMNIDDLDKLSEDELIDLYIKSYPGYGRNMDDIRERMRQKFDYNSTIRIILGNYNLMVTNGRRHKSVTLDPASDGQLKFIVKSIYSDYSNPRVETKITPTTNSRKIKPTIYSR